MHPVRVICIALGLVGAMMAQAADQPFTGTFRGQGRACFGGLFVRAKSIEWNATFSRCGPSAYEILDSELTGERPRLVYLLLKPGKHCRTPVIELAQYQDSMWSVNGYGSIAAYTRQHDSSSVNASTPVEDIYSCGMQRQ